MSKMGAFPNPPSGECKKCRRFLHCLRNSETLKILRLHSKGNSCRRRLHSEAEKLPGSVLGESEKLPAMASQKKKALPKEASSAFGSQRWRRLLLPLKTENRGDICHPPICCSQPSPLTWPLKDVLSEGS